MNTTSKPKYMEFLPKKKRAGILKVIQRPIVNLDIAVVFDFVDSCIRDIIMQLSDKNNKIVDGLDVSSPLFLEQLYISVIYMALHYGKKNDVRDTGDDENIFSEEMFQKMKEEMLVYPEIKNEMLSRISSVYLSKCMEYGLDPNDKIISKLFGE
jgi:hypothetical protein